MECKLFVTRVFVRDWERALLFYTDTLGIPAAFRSDEMGWAQLETGEAQLAVEFLAPPEKQPWCGSLAHFRDPDGNVLTLLGE